MVTYAPCFAAGETLVSRGLSVLKAKYVLSGGFIIIMLPDILLLKLVFKSPEQHNSTAPLFLLKLNKVSHGKF